MQNIVKAYQMGDEEQIVLKGINLKVYEGEFISVLGPSGSGKSTLMNIIGCLDIPTSGTYILGGRNISNLTEKQLARIRNKEIGFVFQSFQLLRDLQLWKMWSCPYLCKGFTVKRRKGQKNCLSK